MFSEKLAGTKVTLPSDGLAVQSDTAGAQSSIEGRAPGRQKKMVRLRVGNPGKVADADLKPFVRKQIRRNAPRVYLEAELVDRGGARVPDHHDTPAASRRTELVAVGDLRTLPHEHVALGTEVEEARRDHAAGIHDRQRWD